MRRRALHLALRVGLVMPAATGIAMANDGASAVGKAPRASETTRPAGRITPAVADMAPADPVAAAFALFPEVRAEVRDEAASAHDRTLPETIPTPPAVTEVEPGVVAVERAVPPSPMVVASYAPASTPAVDVLDKVLRGSDEVAVRAGPTAIAVPLPRRKPAGGATPMKLASLSPELPTSEAPTDVAPIAAETVVLGEPKRIPKEALPYLSILRREAAANKVPLWLAVGVGWVESKYNPNLRGTHGVVGLMQVMPSTARFQGYKGPTEKLLDAETNIVWGMKELGWDWAKSGGNPCMAIAKYKGGIATKGIPSAAADYCKRAKMVTGML